MDTEAKAINHNILKAVGIFSAFALIAPSLAFVWQLFRGSARPPSRVLYVILTLWPASWLANGTPGWHVWRTIGGNIAFFAIIGFFAAVSHRWTPRLIWAIYSVTAIVLLYPFGLE